VRFYNSGLSESVLQRRIVFNHVDGFQVKAVDVNIKDKLKKEIINAILNSPIVKNHIKTYIKATCLPLIRVIHQYRFFISSWAF